MNVNFATEGNVDAIIARRLAEEAGLSAGTPYVCGGKAELDRRIPKYNQAARHSPWLILRDQNSARCPGELARNLLQNPSELLCLRIVPREIEAWLMGDKVKLSRFLSVREAIIPRAPETEANPKQRMVWLASKSTKKIIREEMVPRQGSGIAIGPNYGSLLVEFAELHWRPDQAATNCPALATARQRLTALKGRINAG